MAFFPKSLKTLLKEKAQLQAQIHSRSASLFDYGACTDVSTQELVDALMPLTSQMVDLDRRIRENTPWKQLVARRDELRKILAASAPQDPALTGQRIESFSLDQYLQRSKQKPVTLLRILLVSVLPALIVALMYYFDH